MSWLINIGFVSLSHSTWCFCSAHQAMPYSMFCYTKIQVFKLTARFNKMFHRAVASNKKVVWLGCYIISTSKTVKYFPGEHQVVCGFYFLFFFFSLRERREEDYYFKFDIIFLFCICYYVFKLLKARKTCTLELQRKHGDISSGSEVLGTYFSVLY